MPISEQIEIANLLKILPNDLIQIPHCEPPSSISTLRFSAYYAKSGCIGHLVKLQDALDAMPGSEIVYSVNFGPPNFRTKWLRLPPTLVGCPCPSIVDWYGVLRSLPKVEEKTEENPCGIESASWCSDPHVEPPESPNTYFEPGQYPLGNGFLPLITPNQAD